MRELTVREYLRVSKDDRRTGKSPDQQHNENLLAFKREGFTLHPAQPYRDVDRSASRYTHTTPQAFEQLVRDLENDVFGAGFLALWESSRGSRKVSEWSRLIELCEERSVRIWVTTHGRLYDPSNARDRRSLHEDAVDAEYESDKTSERIRRNVRDAAKRGRPHGKNIYGYRRIYDSTTRELIKIEEHPEQAPVVREAAQRILDGDSLYAIAKDFNLRDIAPRRPTRKDHRSNLGWTPPAVKQMLTTPAYAGKRQHKDQIIGDAIWPAIIEQETWYRLQEILRPDNRRRTNNWPVTHLLSGIAFCAVCRSPLRVGKQNAGSRPTRSSEGETDNDPPARRPRYYAYVCRGAAGRPDPDGKYGFHVAMKEEHLDKIVKELLFARISRRDFLVSLGAKDEKTDIRRKALLVEVKQLQEYLDEVREQAARSLRIDLLIDQEARIMPRIEIAQAELERLAEIDPIVLRLTKNLDRIDEAWRELEIIEKGRVISTIMMPTVSRVDPTLRGVRGKNYERVHPGWK